MRVGFVRPLLIAGLLAGASAGHAAVTTLGGGFGAACYEAAEFKRDTKPSLEICDRALYEEALNNRDRAATFVNRGIINMRARKLDMALKDYEAALKIDPNLAEAHVNRGIALLHIGNRDKDAIESLTQGLALSPSKPEVALYTRGVANELLGDVRRAYEDYSAAAAAAPGWNEPAEQLKRFSVEKRKTQRG